MIGLSSPKKEELRLYDIQSFWIFRDMLTSLKLFLPFTNTLFSWIMYLQVTSPFENST